MLGSNGRSMRSRLGMRTTCVVLLSALWLPLRASGGDELPSAESILDRYVNVTGGKAAYEKRKNMMSSAVLAFGPDMKATLVGYYEAPDRLYQRTELPSMGVTEQCANGDLVWEKSAMMGASVKQGPEKALLKRMALFNPEINWKKIYTGAKTVGVEDVDGKSAYKVEFTLAEGKPDHNYYSKESGFLVKQVTSFPGPMGELPIEIVPSEFREVAGVRVPFKLTQKVGPQQLVITYEKIESNVEIPADRFDPPAEIKALLDKKPETKPSETKGP